MSALDLLEDGFPHGTKDGYERGCKSTGGCQAPEDTMTCSQAYIRYQGDNEYRKLVDAGATAGQIASADAATTVRVKTQKDLQKIAARRTQERVQSIEHADDTPTVETAEHHLIGVDAHGETCSKCGRVEGSFLEHLAGIALVDVGEAEPQKSKRPGPLTTDDERHGTTKGYHAGCRAKSACPGVARVGQSCNQAMNAYMRERHVPKSAQPNAAPAVAEAEAPVEHAVSNAVLEAQPLAEQIAVTIAPNPTDLGPAVTRVPTDVEGLLSDLALAKRDLGTLEDLCEGYARQLLAREDRIRALEEEVTFSSLAADAAINPDRVETILARDLSGAYIGRVIRVHVSDVVMIQDRVQGVAQHTKTGVIWETWSALQTSALDPQTKVEVLR